MNRRLEQPDDWYANAHRQAQRRTSSWNLLLLPLGFGTVAAIWYGLFCLVWEFHVALYPEHEFKDFWNKGVSFCAFIPSFLMVFAIAPGALGAGLMTANFLVWLIPPARRSLDAEAHGHPRASFHTTMKAIGKFTGWSLATGTMVALLAAACLQSLH